MNVFLHELKSYRKVTAIWIGSLILLAAFFFSILPGFEQNAADIEKIFSNFPEAILKAFNLQSGSIASLNGYYPFVFSYILLLGAIQAMYMGISIITKETSGKVADFIYTKPISRMKLLNAKVMALLVILLVSSGVYLGVVLFLGTVMTTLEYDKTAFVMTSVTLIFVQLFCASIGVAIASLRQKIKSVASYAMSIVFSFFIINAVGSALDEEKMRFLSPFSYFPPQYILKHHAYEAQYMIFAAVVTVVCMELAYYVYVKRDIHSA